jgi:hypothetical protein
MGEFKKAREEFEREITRSEDEVKRELDADKTARVKPAANNQSHDA